jgi:preprotein translocase subunit SecE
MNRATKRLMAKQQAAEAKRERPRPQPGAAPGPAEKKKRTPPRQFLREVRSELKKVAWPSRTEVFTYTVVVLVSVVVMTLIVFAMDLGFAKGVLKVFDKNSAPVTAPITPPGSGQQIPPVQIPPVQAS